MEANKLYEFWVGQTGTLELKNTSTRYRNAKIMHNLNVKMSEYIFASNINGLHSSGSNRWSSEEFVDVLHHIRHCSYFREHGDQGKI